MTAIDFKKDPIYKATTTPAIIEVSKMLFAMFDGEGAPESSDGEQTEFQQAFAALFGVVYAIKFWDKKYPTPVGYEKFTMAPVEGLRWIKSGRDFDSANPDDWQWTVMLRLPEFVTQDYFKEVTNELINTEHSDIYKAVRLEYMTEGTCVQVLYIGPYDQEAATINKMHDFARDNGYMATGKHHELYFGDPWRTAPEKRRTMLRQPVSLVHPVY